MIERILNTLLIAGVGAVVLFFLLVLIAYISTRKYPKPDNDTPSGDTSIYLGCHLLGTFLLFLIFSLIIAVFISSAAISAMLHTVAFFVSLWLGHRYVPGVVNPIVDWFLKKKK